MTLPDWITVAVLAALVVAVVMGRRRGKQRFQAAIAHARSSGHAEARAELAAQLTNSVIVNAGNTAPSGVLPAMSGGSDDDVLIAALRRIAVGASVDRNDLDDLHASTDRSRMVDRTRDGFGDLSELADRPAGDRHSGVAARGVGDGPKVTGS